MCTAELGIDIKCSSSTSVELILMGRQKLIEWGKSRVESFCLFLDKSYLILLLYIMCQSIS